LRQHIASGFPTGFHARLTNETPSGHDATGKRPAYRRPYPARSRWFRSLPRDIACSEGPKSCSVLSDSSSITAPFLLHKHTRSEGPFLRRHYPASSVIWPSPTPRPAVALSDHVRSRDFHQSRASPTDPNHLPCMLCSLPRWIGTGARWLSNSALPRRGSSLPVQPSPFFRRVGIHIITFEACSSFTHVTACKVAHPPYVGFIARLRPRRFPSSNARKLSSPTNNYLSGSFPHW
jgi:hypothetical protein